jgi:hypothetical protein
MEKSCLCCKKRFKPHPAVPDQEYCSDPECQKTRKRKWQKEKLANDSDYRANQAEAQKQWRSRNRDYWRQYRKRNPAYTEKNRIRQRERNRGQAVRGRDCKDGRATGENPYPIGPLPACAILQRMFPLKSEQLRIYNSLIIKTYSCFPVISF